jgi:hypothetical protein
MQWPALGRAAMTPLKLRSVLPEREQLRPKRRTLCALPPVRLYFTQTPGCTREKADKSLQAWRLSASYLARESRAYKKATY